MLWVANLWVETVSSDELSEDLNGPHARSEELVEEQCFHGHRPNVARRPVLDVLGDVENVWHLVYCIKQVRQLIVILNWVHYCDIAAVVW